MGQIFVKASRRAKAYVRNSTILTGRRISKALRKQPGIGYARLESKRTQKLLKLSNANGRAFEMKQLRGGNRSVIHNGRKFSRNYWKG